MRPAPGLGAPDRPIRDATIRRPSPRSRRCAMRRSRRSSGAGGDPGGDRRGRRHGLQPAQGAARRAARSDRDPPTPAGCPGGPRHGARCRGRPSGTWINPLRARILPAGARHPRRDPGALWRATDPRLRCRNPRGDRAGRPARRTGLARPARRAGPWLARLTPPGATGRRPPARAPAGSPTPATPRQARPTDRRRRATSRSRLSRYRPIAALSSADRSPACSTRKVRAIDAATSASFIRPEMVLERRDPGDQRSRIVAERLAHELERVAQPLAGDPQLVERLDVRPAQHRLVAADLLVGRPDARRGRVADSVRLRGADRQDGGALGSDELAVVVDPAAVVRRNRARG